MTDPLHIETIRETAMDLHGQIITAYHDPNMTQEQFDALVRQIYGDEPEDEA
jgi:hypothetical protein